MRIALAQQNPTVGDLVGNAVLVRTAAEQAVQARAELLVTSELIVSGYPPKDLLLRGWPSFAEAGRRSRKKLCCRVH